MPRVLFVCTANICRSPVAEALFNAWLARRGGPDGWSAASAGTWAETGAPAATYSREVMAERGFDLNAHRARHIDAEIMAGADLVLCMSRTQAEALQAEFPHLAHRVRLLSAMAGPAYDINDPYGGPRSGYEAMVAELDDLIERGGERILAAAQSK